MLQDQEKSSIFSVQNNSEIIYLYMKYISSTTDALSEGKRKEKCDKGQTVRQHIMSKTVS